MNDLNSVLLEGNLVEKPTIEKLPNGNIICKFFVETFRYPIKDGFFKKEISIFNIESYLPRCHNLDKGHGVRVVGRLKQDLVDFEGQIISEIKIIAEHVELKPDNDIKK